MSIVNVGTPNSGTGDTLYAAFSAINAEFTALEAQIAEISAQENDLGSRNPYTIFVATDGDDSANGHSFAEPVQTLRQGIALANAIKEAEPNARILVSLSPGTYIESQLPLRVGRDITIKGSKLRCCIIKPAVGEERKGFLKVDSGFMMWGLTFSGHQADDEEQAWVVQLDDEADNTALGATSTGAYLTVSPYFQNCTSYTAEDDSGEAPSLSVGSSGNGILVDGDACAANSPIRSIVLDSFTQVNLGGIGCKVINDAYAQLVSFFGTFCEYHVLCESGGQVNLVGGTTDFGKYGLVADSYSKTPLYTAQAYRDHYGIRRSEIGFSVGSNNTLSSTAHGLVNDAPVTVKTATNLPLQPTLSASVVYYLRDVTENTVKLAATVGGDVITISNSNSYTNVINLVNQGELSVYCKNFTDSRIGSASRPGNGVLMFPSLVFPRAGSLAADDSTPGTVDSVVQNGNAYYAQAILDTAPSIVGTHEYVPNSGTVTVTRSNIFVNEEGATIETTPVAGLNTFTFDVISITYNHLTGLTTFRAEDYVPNALDEFYFTNCEFICQLSAYTVTSAEPINSFGNVVAEVDGVVPYGYKVNLFNATNGGLIYSILENAKLDFRRRSQISSPSHVFEYVGSGMNYKALPENGGVPVQANGWVERNSGRVCISWSNEKGDFGVSDRFFVNGTTGEVTISTSSFNLSGLNQIGAFSRNGGLSTVGVVLKEVSDNRNMISSLGIPDANTVPTQTAVVDYVTETLALSLPNGAIVNDTAFYFSSQEPYPTVRIDDTPIKAGDVLWDKIKSNWYTFDGTEWILARFRYVPEITRGAFTTVWDTTKLSTGSSTNTQIKLPLISQGVYDFTVDWGDGTTNAIQAWNAAAATHTYAVAGTYTVNITGILHGFCFNNSGDKLKLMAIAQWGILRVATLTYSGANSFYGCANLIFLNNDFLDTTNLTSLRSFFYDCSSITTIPGLFLWDVSNVTNMSQTFRNCTNFNHPITDWDVSSVTDMSYMFSNCSNFNQSLANWDVSSVTNMSRLFYGCSNFNQSLVGWGVSNVTDMAYTFYGCTNFNQPLASWDVSSVTTMSYMLRSCTNFNQPLATWDVSNVTDMQNLLVLANAWDNSYYDACLLAWSALTLQPNVVAHFGDAKYTETAARAILTSAPNNWTITDGGAL